MTSFALMSRLCGRLPRRTTEFIVGKVFVRTLMMGLPANRRAALSSLDRILRFSGKTPEPAELRRLLDESLALYTRFILLMMALPEDLEYSASKVDMELLPAVEELKKAGKGVVLATPNFGLIGHAIIGLMQRGVLDYLPVLNRNYFAHFPPELFARFQTVGKSSLLCLRALRKNGLVGAIVDINYLPHRQTTEFFGGPAPLGYAASRLAQVSGAPLLPAYAVASGDRCRFVADAAILPEGRSLEQINRELARSMERFISRYPEQWLVYDDFWNTSRMDLQYKLARAMSRLS
ncbi:MAG: lysophospholipid acyltransferase family protein [Elusimicrobiota bacterium]